MAQDIAQKVAISYNYWDIIQPSQCISGLLPNVIFAQKSLFGKIPKKIYPLTFQVNIKICFENFPQTRLLNQKAHSATVPFQKNLNATG